MSAKKSNIADLDSRRPTWFLLALIVIFSVFFVALEYTTREGDFDSDMDLLDDLAQDMELQPLDDTKDMIAAAIPKPPTSATQKVKTVDKMEKSPDTKILNDPLTLGNQEGEAENSKIEEAVQQEANAPEAEGPIKLDIVEQLPEFPGGMVELMKWLTRNLHYPPQAQMHKIQGKVVVSFVINTDGSLTAMKVEKGVNPLLDREALRVIRMMPKWKPGSYHNKPCRTLFAIPVVFQL